MLVFALSLTRSAFASSPKVSVGSIAQIATVQPSVTQLATEKLIPKPKEQPKTTQLPDSAKLSFESINNYWWKRWQSLSAEQKSVWLDEISLSYESAISQMPLSSSAREHVAATRGLIKALRKIINYESNVVKIDQYSNYTLREWADFYDRYRALNDNAKRLEAEIKQRNDGVLSVKQQIQELAVDHRASKSFSNKSVELTLNIYSSQLSLLYSQEKQSVATQQLGNIKSALKLVAVRLESSTSLLSSSEDFDRELIERKQLLNQKLDKIKSVMSYLQRQAWSSVAGDQEVVYQLSFHEEKLKNMAIQSEQLGIDILLRISELLQQNEVKNNPGWHSELKELNQEYERLKSQFFSYRERVIASGHAANEMIFEQTQRSVWEYLESNQKLANEYRVKLDQAAFYSNAYKQFLAIKKGWASEVDLDWQLLSADAKTGWSGFVNFTLFSVNEYPVTLGDVINALMVIIVAILVSKLIKKILRRIGRRRAISESTLFNVARVIHYVIITAAILVALSILGIDSSKIALVAGALSVGIGFGLQAIFNNFVSGLILLFERPLKVGDLVELESGVRGRIKAINVRSTQLKTRDNIDLLVPNSEFVNFKVINYTFSDPLRRIHVAFRTSLDSDKERVKDVVVQAAQNVSFTQQDKQHEPDVWLKRIGEFCLEFELIVWVNANKLHDNDGVESHYLWEVDTALREANIEIPVPRQSLLIERPRKEQRNKE
ncbi:MAG: mechanosensitive ion channel [Gammaproteobacteria bacterium]|nr:mechanosensitive ion channel [Gammaproteobacteria bacterium]